MTKRKPYQKPEIKQVDLAPEEAVLTACKLDTGSNNKVQTDPNGCYKNTTWSCQLGGS
jgi:hypothetical protein